MKFEGISFNVKWVKSMTKVQFIGHVSNQHHWPNLTITQRKQRLNEVYKLCELLIN